MEGLKYTKKAIAWFFAIVIILSACAEGLIISGKPEWLIIILMWIPALAGNIALFIMHRDEKVPFSIKRAFTNIGFRKCKLKYFFMGWFIPLIYLGIPYIIYWLIYPKNFGYYDSTLFNMLKDCAPMMILGVFISLQTALGEEMGWRGFLVPALNEKLGLVKMLLITSLFWCVWHMPLLVAGDYMAGTALWYKIPAFTLCIFPVGIMAAVLTLESGSVWPAAFLHAAHNNYDQAVFDVITKGDNRMYFVSETGILTIVCAWILAIIICVRFVKSKR